MGVPACAQKRASYSVPAITVQDLLSSPGSEVRMGMQAGQDSIASVTYAQLFKEGEAHYASLDEQRLKQLPPLPTGYRLFKGLAFDLESKAVASGSNIIVFHIPSASQPEFSKLRILHLEYDELSPTETSWLDKTVIADRWRQESFPLIQKENYVKLSPDFSHRMISSVVDEFGTFVIASLERAEDPPLNKPSTDIGIDVQVSPEAVRAGEEITYTFTISNKGDQEAGYVGFIYNLDPDIDLISFSAERGSCKESRQSTGRVLCLLSGVRTSESVTITIKTRIRHNKLWEGKARENVDTATVVFKEGAADPLYNFVRKQVKTSIIP